MIGFCLAAGALKSGHALTTHLRPDAAQVVRLSAAAHEGVLGLLGVAALPPDVVIEQTDEGPRYHVPEDWFLTTPA